MKQYFLLERDADVVKLVINYPEKRNMMNDEMGRQFHSICGDLAGDSKLRAVVITGAGKAFCAGGDLDWLLEKSKRSPEENRRDMYDFYNLFLRVRDIEVPVIAAINGAAMGAGMVMPMACDIRYAARSATMGATFVKLGINPGMGSSWLFPKIVGPQRAMLLLAAGKVVGADEAFRLGLIEKVCDDDKLVDEAMALAREIASMAPISVRWAKKTIWSSLDTALKDHLKDEAMGQSICYGTSDFKEGIKATQEKRPGKFCGK